MLLWLARSELDGSSVVPVWSVAVLR